MSLTNEEIIPLLEKWRGADAQLWTYQVGHSVLTLRLMRNGKKEYLELILASCEFIQAPSYWKDATLDLRPRNVKKEYVLADPKAGVELRAIRIAASEKSGYAPAAT